MRKRAFSPLVGRSEELGRVRRAAALAAAGYPGLVMVEGEAGIGKSRLVFEVTGSLRADGWLAVRGHCSALAGRSLSLAPWVQVLRDLRAACEPDEFQSMAGLIHELVAPLLDDATRISAQNEHAGLVVPESIYDAMGELLRRASARSSLLVVVEDAHWADQSSLAFLDHLVRTLRSEPVLLLVTIRTLDGSADAIGAARAELRRLANAESVELRRLNASQVVEQVRNLTGNDRNAQLEERALRLSDGVPFLVEEVVDAAARGADASIVAEHALGHRLDILGPEAAILVEVASVSVDPVSLRVLAAVCARFGLEAGFDAALLEARRLGVLELDAAAGNCSFRHALLAEAARSRVLPRARARLHGEWAHALEQQLASGIGGESPAALARHWLEADDPEPALRWSLVAAANAQTLGGVRERLDLLLTAARLWERVPDAEQVSGTTLARIYANAAEAANLAGDIPASDELIRQAREAMSEQPEQLVGAWLTVIDSWNVQSEGRSHPDVSAAGGVRCDLDAAAWAGVRPRLHGLGQ